MAGLLINVGAGPGGADIPVGNVAGTVVGSGFGSYVGIINVELVNEDAVNVTITGFAFSSISPATAQFGIQNSNPNLVLASGEKQIIQVIFTPIVADITSFTICTATLVISNNGSTGDQTVGVNGVASPPTMGYGQLSINGYFINLGPGIPNDVVDVGNYTQQVVVTLTNTGTGPLSLQNVFYTLPFMPGPLQGPYATSIAPGQNVQFGVVGLPPAGINYGIAISFVCGDGQHDCFLGCIGTAITSAYIVSNPPITLIMAQGISLVTCANTEPAIYTPESAASLPVLLKMHNFQLPYIEKGIIKFFLHYENWGAFTLTLTMTGDNGTPVVFVFNLGNVGGTGALTTFIFECSTYKPSSNTQMAKGEYVNVQIKIGHNQPIVIVDYGFEIDTNLDMTSLIYSPFVTSAYNVTSAASLGLLAAQGKTLYLVDPTNPPETTASLTKLYDTLQKGIESSMFQFLVRWEDLFSTPVTGTVSVTSKRSGQPAITGTQNYSQPPNGSTYGSGFVLNTWYDFEATDEQIEVTFTLAVNIQASLTELMLREEPRGEIQENA